MSPFEMCGERERDDLYRARPRFKKMKVKDVTEKSKETLQLMLLLFYLFKPSFLSADPGSAVVYLLENVLKKLKLSR